MCLSALTRFGVTQTLAQSFLSSQGLCKIGSHWTSPIIEGCGFFPFSSGFTVFLLSRPCIFRGGKVGLGKLPRARRRKANIAQRHRGIMSHCESWVRTLSMEAVHLEWLELGQGTTHCRILDSSLVPSLLFLPCLLCFCPGVAGQELSLPSGVLCACPKAMSPRAGDS